MAAVTICSDLGAQENKICHCFHFPSLLFAMKWWDQMPWSWFFECRVLSQLLHSAFHSHQEAFWFLLIFCHLSVIIYICEVVYISPESAKNWCFQIVVLEKTLESPLDSKEIKSINTKGNQPWIFIGRTDAEAEPSILWPPDVKSQLIGKDPDGGKDWGQEEKRVTEDEMVGWHH